MKNFSPFSHSLTLLSFSKKVKSLLYLIHKFLSQFNAHSLHVSSSLDPLSSTTLSSPRPINLSTYLT